MVKYKFADMYVGRPKNDQVQLCRKTHPGISGNAQVVLSNSIKCLGTLRRSQDLLAALAIVLTL